MQTKSLRIKSYRSWPIADTASSEAITRMKKLELYDQLKSEGCSMVLHLRQRYRLWGKRKIWKVLCRDHGFTLSISTVGRILKRLIELGRIRSVAFYYGQIKPKRQRQFKHHAKRWRYGMKAKQPGELIQIDHMSVNFTEGFTLAGNASILPSNEVTLMKAKPRWMPINVVSKN